mmetsp:Transcript_31637/g.39677  ORF Transcript_31637/g.39677 Transcript_31637/m.39677 type:complete len:434 (+) Transcript_31637:367-1668(+)
MCPKVHTAPSSEIKNSSTHSAAPLQFTRINIASTELQYSISVNPWFSRKQVGIFLPAHRQQHRPVTEHWLLRTAWASLIVNLGNIDRAVLKFPALQLSKSDLMKVIIRTCLQILKLPGNLECFGSPNSVLSEIFYPSSAIIPQPILETGRKTFASCKIKTKILPLRFFNGCCVLVETTLDHVLLGLGNPSLVCLDFGSQRLVPSNTLEGFLHGVVGLLREPLFWCSIHGLPGLAIGVTAGVLGVPFKIFFGTVQTFASTAKLLGSCFGGASALAQGRLESEVKMQLRPPRIFTSAQPILCCGSFQQSLQTLSRENLNKCQRKEQNWTTFSNNQTICLIEGRLFSVDSRLTHILLWEIWLDDIISVDAWSNETFGVHHVIIEHSIPQDSICLKSIKDIKFTKTRIKCRDQLQQCLILDSIIPAAIAFTSTKPNT